MREDTTTVRSNVRNNAYTFRSTGQLGISAVNLPSQEHVTHIGDVHLAVSSEPSFEKVSISG